jgi:antitoxin (DNA-binding transcriptional repressor) of toxin-antitoxin stability system
MHSLSLSQLRDTRRLKALLRAGNTVELRERHRVIARIIPVPVAKPTETPVQWPDFAARRKKIFGNRILPAVDFFLKERGRY